ncbi:hypothetical protein S40285_06864 [Stachybotrys chlorohalonatus IBT 40285]|uniref:AttH domain-containing protein n=1 Tax=Stachybotrys chlorohalonatus (strain IBT 40285) TaxID=1283841 RepID=A0A084QE62_STAC4|nr:hypothetical protein S40285_06864 [Stachybotrys chlorohalonata IBT 40285]
MRFSTTLPAALSFIGTVTADFWACDIQPGIQIFPADVRLESVSNQTLTCSHSFDAPKVLPVGDTSYDWWYFDAVADDGIQSLVVVFMQKGENSDFPGPAFTAYVQITGTLSNGTAFTETIPVDQGIVSTSGFGSNGLWGNSNLSWVGTPDLSEYQVRLDAADGTITGLFTLQSIAPPHGPSGSVGPGQSLELMPGVGWAVSIPDAVATVDVNVRGRRLNFTGAGYHDKNWGSTLFTPNVGGWYWGHTHLGPYSLVWLDALTQVQDEYANGYIALDGEIVRSGPRFHDGVPEGFHITADLGDAGVLEASVRYTVVAASFTSYGRWAGIINGTIASTTTNSTVESKTYLGVTHYEIFNLF